MDFVFGGVFFSIGTVLIAVGLHLRRRRQQSIRPAPAPTLAKTNDREVGQLRTLLGWADPVATLRAARPRIVVVTHGAAGSTIHPLDGAPIEIPGAPSQPGGAG